MDAGRSPVRLKDGYMSRVVGADGRYVGSIRPFPGFTRVTTLPSVTAAKPCTGFEFFAAQVVGSSEYIRGYVYRYTSSTGKSTISIYGYTGSAWVTEKKVYDDSTAVHGKRFSVASAGPYLYIAVEGQSLVVMSYSGSAWVGPVTAGPKPTANWTNPPVVSPTVTNETGNGVLTAGTYSVAYRFFNSSRNVYSDISPTYQIAVAADDDHIDMNIPYPFSADGAEVDDYFDKVEVFRTLQVEAAGSFYDGGILFREQLVAVTAGAAWDAAAESMTVHVGGDTDGLTDYVLAQQKAYEPRMDRTGIPPTSGVVSVHEGVTFMGTAPTDVGGAGIQWSPTFRYDPESFPSHQKIRGQVTAGPILRFVEAGDVVYAMTSNVMYRIRLVGNLVSLIRLHDGLGLVAAKAAHAIGRDIMALTGTGLVLIDGANANVSLVSSCDRILKEVWDVVLDDSLSSAADSRMGASFFLNTRHDEMIVVWHGGMATTMLEDCTFADSTQGPDPLTGGLSRAFFVSSTGVVFTPDVTSSLYHNMWGIGSGITLNGTMTTGCGATTLKDSTATFDDTVIGATVWWFDVSAGVWRRMTDVVSARVDAHTLTIGTAQSPVPVAGDRYSIAPVAFRLRLAPMKAISPDQPDFERKVVSSIGVQAAKWADNTDNPNAKWFCGVYRELGDTLEDCAEAGAAVDGQQVARVSASGVILEPSVEMFASGVNFELTGVQVKGTITTSTDAVAD